MTPKFKLHLKVITSFDLVIPLTGNCTGLFNAMSFTIMKSIFITTKKYF